MVIIGITDIFVKQGNKRADIGFSVRYTVKSFTDSPSDAPTTSAAPTLVLPLGVQVCQCDKKQNCVDDKVQSNMAREVQICLRSTPAKSKIVRIEYLFFEMKEIIQLVVNNDKEVAGLPTSIYPFTEENESFRMIESRLKEDFFRDNSTLYNIMARGSALVAAEPGDAASFE